MSRRLKSVANTSSRTLRLLSLLQSQRYWPGTELADRLEVSVRTLRRDVDRLRELGYPVAGARGVDGGYQLAAGASLPPLALDDEEAVALAVGLQAATASAIAPMAEPSLRALAKVTQVMPARLRRQVDALRAMTVTASWSPGTSGPDPAVLLTAAQACRAGEGLALDYTAADRRPDPATGGTASPGLHRQALVSGRLRPRPSGMAQFPARPRHLDGRRRQALPAAGTPRRGRSRLRPAEHHRRPDEP